MFSNNPLNLLYFAAAMVGFAVNFGLHYQFGVDFAISLMVGLVAMHLSVVIGKKIFFK
ncbi:MAG TPA: hypothetical protein PLE50_00225 [Rhabdaerophilum sp.]|nr:hypothetical protein [Rhabdaerophilum sp.]